jgi:Iron-containing redox enzyme
VQVPASRGPLSARVRARLLGGPEPADAEAQPTGRPDPDVVLDEDRQATLWMLYELHYRGFEGVDERLEWDPGLLGLRRGLEAELEGALVERTAPLVTRFLAGSGDLVADFFDVVAETGTGGLTRYVATRATVGEVFELLVHRSVYQLKEADPHAWAVPRLTGEAEAALLDILHDEYGAGRADRLHARLFAQTLQSCGLDPSYGAYVDRVPAEVLAVSNAMSLLGLHRRLVPAAMGHLAAFEATSSLPARRVARGMRRLGLPEAAVAYFDEHVLADAVHEQVALRWLCGSLVREDPRLLWTVAFGAATCLHLDDLAGSRLLRRWTSPSASAGGTGRTGSRRPA